MKITGVLSLLSKFHQIKPKFPDVPYRNLQVFHFKFQGFIEINADSTCDEKTCQKP
jgi:hypothetical protein